MAVTDLYSVPVFDDAGKQRRVQVYFPHGPTLAQYQAFSDLFLAKLDLVLGGALGTPSITQNLTPLVGVKASPIADHFNRQGTLVTQVAAGTNYKHGTYLPSWRISLIDGGDPNVSGADAVALLGYLTAGDGTISPSDKYGNDITSVYSTKLKFRK